MLRQYYRISSKDLSRFYKDLRESKMECDKNIEEYVKKLFGENWDSTKVMVMGDSSTGIHHFQLSNDFHGFELLDKLPKGLKYIKKGREYKIGFALNADIKTKEGKKIKKEMKNCKIVDINPTILAKFLTLPELIEPQDNGSLMFAKSQIVKGKKNDNFYAVIPIGRGPVDQEWLKNKHIEKVEEITFTELENNY